MKRDEKNLRKNVFRLGLASFFTDMSSEMIFPVLPIFLTTVLGANMAVVGLIEGIAESSSTLFKLFSGWLADKWGKKKPLVVVGYSFSTFTKPLLALATHWGHVLVVRFADRLGKGIRTAPRDALITASTSPHERGRKFGLHRAMDTAGAIAGTLIAFFILQKWLSDAFRMIFWLSFFPGLAAMGVLIFGVREANDHIKPKKITFNFSACDPALKRFLVVVTLFGLSNFSYAFFLLRAKDVGLTLFLIPLVYLVYNLMYAGFAIPVGRLSDRLGRTSVLAVGMLLFGLTALGFGQWATTSTLWPLFALYGLFMAVTDGVSRAFVSDMATAETRGIVFGTYHTLVGLAVLPANLLGGFLWKTFSAPVPFFLASIVSIFSALLMVLWVRPK